MCRATRVWALCAYLASRRRPGPGGHWGAPGQLLQRHRTLGMMVNWEVIVMMIDISHDDDDDDDYA